MTSWLLGLSTADLCDLDESVAVMDGGIRPVWQGARLSGTAVTVSVPPGELGGVQDALELIGAGDVLVVDAGGDLLHAVLGDRMGQRILDRGGAGAVVDGAVRDSIALAELSLGVFARGVSPRRAPQRRGGRPGGPIHVGGAVVRTGDLVVADADGVVVISDIIAKSISRERSRPADAW